MSYTDVVRDLVASGMVPHEEIALRSLPLGPRRAPFESVHVVGDAVALRSPLVAVTGSARADEREIEAARSCGRAAARAGSSLVCGGAAGCEAEAARACLELGGSVVIVPGAGPDFCHPSSSEDVFMEAALGRGCVCSPYAPGEPPTRARAGKRAYLVVALADEVICPASGRPLRSFDLLERACANGVPVTLVEESGIKPADLFPSLATIREVARGDRLEAELADLIRAARPMRVCREIATGIAEALHEWSASVHAADGGPYLELETLGALTGYDFVGYIDMRGLDPMDPADWSREARELAESFDVDHEVEINLGGRGAPSVERMVEEFVDMRDRVLPVLAATVREVAEEVTGRLAPAPSNPSLSEAASQPAAEPPREVPAPSRER